MSALAAATKELDLARVRQQISDLESEALRQAIPRLADFADQIERIEAAERAQAATGGLSFEPTIEQLEKLADHLAIGREASARFAKEYMESLEEARIATGRFAESAATSLTDNFFGVVEGRFKSFGDGLVETLKDVGKQIFELGLTNVLRGAFGLQPVGGRGLLSLFGAAPSFIAQGGASPNIGIAGVSGLGSGFLPGPPLLQLATPLPGGLSVNRPPVGGISLLGVLGAGLGGAGLGATLFPDTTLESSILGGLGGIGGSIAGTALAAGIGGILGSAIPIVGTIAGGLIGGFLGSFFGGNKAQEQAEARSRTAQGTQVINAIINQPNVAQWQQDHPILANSLAGLVFHFNRQDSRIEFARHQSDFQIVLSELFQDDRLPSVQDYIRQMLRITTPADLAPGLGGTLNVAAIEAEEARRREEAARTLRLQEFGRQELPGITAGLFEAGFAERGIAGVRDVDPGLLAQIGVTTRIDRLDGVERLRITRRQIDAVDDLSPEAVERLWQKVLDYLRRSGRPTGGLIEALQ